MKRILLLLALALFSHPATAQSVTIVAFNAENLFDTADDPDNPGDDTYLPLAAKDRNRQQHDLKCGRFYGDAGFFVDECRTLNWSEEVYATKLERYAGVIKAMAPTPDVIVIPETENKSVLDDLVSRHLSTAGYKVIQLDTSDKLANRGIDVGILTRLELAGSPEAHQVTFGNRGEACGRTRDIVGVPLRLPDGETLHLFAVHFPSGSNQFECRIRAFKKLNELVNALPAGSLAVAAGDFNFNCNESPTDAITRLLKRGNWYASPLVRQGCDAPGSSKNTNSLLYYSNTWSFLDAIFVSADLSPTIPSTKNWFAELGSFGTVVVHPEQVMVDEHGHVQPRPFDSASGRGVSDHWPVAIRLLPRRDQPSSEASPERR